MPKDGRIGNVAKSQNTILYEVPIFDINGNRSIIKAYAIDEICQGEENINLSRITKLFTNLKTEDVLRSNKSVELLIGMDYAHLHPQPVEANGNLVLYQSKFGSGKVLGGQHKLIVKGDTVSRFTRIVAHAKIGRSLKT